MDDRHISAAMARAFFRGEVSPEDRLFFIRHLLSDCRSCRDLVMQIAKVEGATLPLDEDRTNPEIPEPSFEIAILRIVGLAQWSLFESISPEQRDALLDSDPNFCHFGFYDRLLEAALYAARDDPREGEDIALLALKVATKITGVSHTLREDLIAGAYAVLGNTIRQRGDYDLAAETFTQAWNHIEEGTGDLLVTARVQQYEASLVSG
jgi:hypothetical protein